MPTVRPYPQQEPFKAWLAGRGIKHTWAARHLGYSKQHFSRVIMGTARLTAEFRHRCADKLEVPDDVWRITQNPLH